MDLSKIATSKECRDALNTAIDGHAGQCRVNGEPYVYHPIRVAISVSHLGIPYIIAALGHDLIEDTAMTADDLRRKSFPEEAVQAILALTKLDGESYKNFILRASKNHIAKAVKDADIVDNLGVNGDLWFDPVGDVDELRHAKRIYKYFRALAFLRGKISESRYLKNKVAIVLEKEY